MNLILHIALPCPLRLTFDYLAIPSEVKLNKGIRVYVPFRSRSLIGVVVGISQTNRSVDRLNLKTVTKYIDEYPLLSSELLALVKWMSQYYHHPIGECIQSVLPKKLRLGESVELIKEPAWRLLYNRTAPSLGKKQQQIIQLFQKPSQCLSQRYIYQQIGPCLSSLTALQKRGLLKTKEIVKIPINKTQQLLSFFKLNQEQQIAVDRVWENKNMFSPYLLHGVTGSGKTEVYIELVRRALTQGKQVMVLIPEINLTVQLIDRFNRCLAGKIVVLNSNVSDSERKQSWLLIKEGLVDIIIGTRSAVFVPMKSPGLIIIDEEHDKAYKQQDGFKYHARNIALVSAKQLGIPIVLGSATPSLESLYCVKQNRYQLLSLTKRATGVALPKVNLVDISGLTGRTIISSELYHAIQNQINKNNQVLLFINRRGFAPVLLCYTCGWQAICVDCDAKMVVHKDQGVLMCHHCGLVSVITSQCPECQSMDVVTHGAGTEQIEQVLQRYFPNAPVIRVDQDSMRTTNAFSTIVSNIQQGGSKILVGTQMLTKGHDFKDVTIVGVLDPDQGLFSADFRATETLAQLITQVIGRAGRSKKKGEVFIQTRQPQHEFWRNILGKGYIYTVEKILKQRQDAMLPPAGSVCVIRSEDKQKHLATQFLIEVAAILNQYRGQVMLAGPMPAMMKKKAGRYRVQLLLISPHKKPIHQLLDCCISKILAYKLTKKIKWSIDIDPIDLF